MISVKRGTRKTMIGRGVAFVLLGVVGLALGGCVESTLAPASDANLKPRDRQLLANAPYAQAAMPAQLHGFVHCAEPRA